MKRHIPILLFAIISLLLNTSCSKDDVTSGESTEPKGSVIHYSATVSDGSNTRATLDDEKKYIFETGDILRITGTNISGDLTLKTGAGTNSAIFEGDLTYTVSGTPDASLELKAVLVSTSNEMSTLTYEAATYPTTAIASTLAEAVQKYSYFKATSTYGAKNFTLDQQSAFLNFTVTILDGTSTGDPLSIDINNGGTSVRTGTVTTATSGSDIVAQFVAVFPVGTTMSNASVQLGSKAAIPFGGSTALAANKIYNIKKTIYPVPATFTYTGYRQTYAVPASGWYTIQAYGAEGGKSFTNLEYGDGKNNGGKGGYSSISYYLTKGQALSIYCGGIGGDATRAASGGGAAGWNGGGAGGNGYASTYTGGGGGGGATYVATTDLGLISSTNALYTGDFVTKPGLILVAGGGGGGAYNNCTAGAGGGNNCNLGTRASDGKTSDSYMNVTVTGSQGGNGNNSSADDNHKRGGSGGHGGGFKAIPTLSGQNMTYAGFGGSSWGDTTNGTGYNSVSGGATEGGNGKVIISWVNSPLQGLNDYNQENKDW
jgi:hypothetical protein